VDVNVDKMTEPKQGAKKVIKKVKKKSERASSVCGIVVFFFFLFSLVSGDEERCDVCVF